VLQAVVFLHSACLSKLSFTSPSRLLTAWHLGVIQGSDSHRCQDFRSFHGTLQSTCVMVLAFNIASADVIMLGIAKPTQSNANFCP
jgi:hypothetical protein